jgi:adenine-specific DNA methylase
MGNSVAAIGTLPEILTPAEKAKCLGVFYTDARVADFLVGWAVRSARDTVLDPSFGGGAFLRSACERIRALGGDPASQVLGVEIDSEVHGRVSAELASAFGLTNGHLILSDFFGTDVETVGCVAAVVGNPPFVRYHRFTGESRAIALRKAAEQKVRLSRLTSSWAPFLVHSCSMIRRGGRLAMVLPMEIAYASYARPVLDYLARSFARVTFLTFRKKLFPDLSEDTLLLLAEGRGESPHGFFWRDLADAETLRGLGAGGRPRLSGLQRLDTEGFCQGSQRLMECWVPKKARDLYRSLRQAGLTTRLGDIAEVGIGYVTGANDFFHLSHGDIARWGIPDGLLQPAVRRGRSLAGLRFTQEDWHSAIRAGEAAFLLLIEGGRTELPTGVRQYLAHGEEQGVHKTFKCRTRTPWYSVPHVFVPDAFLTYMSGVFPRLVANDARVVAPNSLHVLRMRPLSGFSGHALAALWQTALTGLSVEIEGHALGGGMLKMEPTEAENVLVPATRVGQSELRSLARELDTLVRGGRDSDAQALADKALLMDGLGMEAADCRLLRNAARLLRRRRYSRG